MGVTTAPAPARVRPNRTVATRPVAVVAALMAIPLLLTANRYGYFGDELYFVAAGRPPRVGVRRPAAAASVARQDDGHDRAPLGVALRIPAMLAMVAGIVLAGLMARELGGGAGRRR